VGTYIKRRRNPEQCQYTKGGYVERY